MLKISSTQHWNQKQRPPARDPNTFLTPRDKEHIHRQYINQRFLITIQLVLHFSCINYFNSGPSIDRINQNMILSISLIALSFDYKHSIKEARNQMCAPLPIPKRKNFIKRILTIDNKLTGSLTEHLMNTIYQYTLVYTASSIKLKNTQRDRNISPLYPMPMNMRTVLWP